MSQYVSTLSLDQINTLDQFLVGKVYLPSKGRKTYQWGCSNQKDCRIFRDFMYLDGGFSLSRKKNIFYGEK